jgi:hypothetical protein
MKATKSSKTNLKAQIDANKAKSAPKNRIEKEIASSKPKGIENSGMVQVSEAVGLHFSISADWKGPIPAEGDLISAKVAGQDIPLIVRTSFQKKDGSHFIQAFLVEKGSGHHLVLEEQKGKLAAQVTWA